MLNNKQSEFSFTIVATGAARVMQLDYSTQIKVLFNFNKSSKGRHTYTKLSRTVPRLVAKTAAVITSYCNSAPKAHSNACFWMMR